MSSTCSFRKTLQELSQNSRVLIDENEMKFFLKEHLFSSSQIVIPKGSGPGALISSHKG